MLIQYFHNTLSLTYNFPTVRKSALQLYPNTNTKNVLKLKYLAYAIG